jgi:hypothetical protein
MVLGRSMENTAIADAGYHSFVVGLGAVVWLTIACLDLMFAE